MINSKSEAQMLALFIIDELPDAVTLSELYEILISSTELSPMDVPQYVENLLDSGQIYIEDSSNSARYDAAKSSLYEKYVGITEMGRELVWTLSAKKSLLRGAINRAMRHYKKLILGIEYKIEMEKAKDGSYVHFKMYISDKLYFSTSLFFAKSSEALAVYDRMDDDPEAFYSGFLTVASGSIDYLT